MDNAKSQRYCCTPRNNITAHRCPLPQPIRWGEPRGAHPRSALWMQSPPHRRAVLAPCAAVGSPVLPSALPLQSLPSITGGRRPPATEDTADGAACDRAAPLSSQTRRYRLRRATPSSECRQRRHGDCTGEVAGVGGTARMFYDNPRRTIWTENRCL